jgi:prepilin-type N-terminal cleavage/methylation domain-containing protein
MFKFGHKTKKGFSLIEMVIVLVLILLMTGVLFANSKDDTYQADVDGSTAQILTQLRSLQNDSLNGKIITVGGVQHIICTAYMTTTNDDNMIVKTYGEHCDTAESSIAGYREDIPLKNAKMEFTPPAPIVKFATPNGQINDGAGKIKISIVSTRNDTKMNTICINKVTGNITDYKGDQNCP